MAASGTEAGAENVRRLRKYLDDLKSEDRPLPERGGRPNVSAIALACGFDRQVLYKNPAAKALLDEAMAALGLAKVETQAASEDKLKQTNDLRDRRIHRLEQENVTLRAEVTELRQRLRRVAHVESHMVETGRRVAPLFASLGETEK